MNGVIMPSVSAGSSQRDASVMCTPHVIVPSGAAAAGAARPIRIRPATSEARNRVIGRGPSWKAWIATVALVFGAPSSQRQRSKLAPTWPRSSVGALALTPGYHTLAACRREVDLRKRLTGVSGLPAYRVQRALGEALRLRPCQLVIMQVLQALVLNGRQLSTSPLPLQIGQARSSS